MRQDLWPIWLGLALILGCHKPGTSHVEWTGTRDTVRGVEVVRGPFSLPDTEAPTHVRELWRATDTGGRGPWEEPRILALGIDRVAVLDPQAHRVYVHATGSGEDLGALGREGGGPGELQRPFGLEFVGDTLAIGNGGGPRIDLFAPVDTPSEAKDSPYAYARSIRLDVLPFTLESLGDGRLLMTALSGRDGVNLLLTLDGESEAYEAPDTSIVDPELLFSECPRWAAGEDRLIRGCGTRFAFQELSYGGELLREVHVERPPVMASAAELDSLETTMRKSLTEVAMSDVQKEAFIERMLERARVKAVYAAFRTDTATGRVYVLDQTPADSGGDAATLHVLDEMGRYFARIAFDQPWRTFEVSGARIYALEQDPATGLTTLVAYEVDLPSTYAID